MLLPASSTFPDCRQFFTPFGQQSDGCGSFDRRVDFTGKESDNESRFTYFGARYHDPLMGRFLSVDPALESASLEDPQSWNRYSYTFNRPMNHIDPDGRATTVLRTAVIIGSAVTIAAIVYPQLVQNEKVQRAARNVGKSIESGLETVSNTISSAFSAAVGYLSSAADGPSDSVSEESGEPDAEFEENTDLGVPGTLRNPDGTRKDPEDQLEGLLEAKEQGQLIETTGKSRQNIENRLRSIRGRSTAEAIKEFENN